MVVGAPPLEALARAQALGLNRCLSGAGDQAIGGRPEQHRAVAVSMATPLGHAKPVGVEQGSARESVKRPHPRSNVARLTELRNPPRRAGTPMHARHLRKIAPVDTDVLHDPCPWLATSGRS
jgi:hypothetical protein